MIVLDATIVLVALPAVQEALRFSPADLAWVVNGYTLAFGGFLLLGGRLADRVGAAGSSWRGGGVRHRQPARRSRAEPGEPPRALQGLGGAVMSPAALSLLTVIFTEGRQRDSALGVWAGISAGGAAIGLILGGLLTQYASWRWVFFVNVPIALGAVVAARAFVPESRDEHARGFDVAGAVTATGGLVALVYALVRGNELGWTSGQTLLTLALAAILLTVFVIIVQRRKADPLRQGGRRHVDGAGRG